ATSQGCRSQLRVKLRRHGRAMTRPVYLQQRTFLVAAGTAVECQLRTRAPQQNLVLFNHLVGARKQRWRHLDAERLGGFGVDHQLELARLLDRQIRWLGALEDATGIDAELTIRVREAGSVAHQPAGFGKVTLWIDRGD